jgi:hypothetical protein
VERLGKGDFVLQEKVGRVRIRKASRREREVGMVRACVEDCSRR